MYHICNKDFRGKTENTSPEKVIMSSKMKVASQHWTEWTDWTDCTKQNKRHFYTIKIEKIFIHDSRVQHPVLSSVRGTLRVPRT